MTNLVKAIEADFQVIYDALIERDLLIDSNAFKPHITSAGTRLSWPNPTGLSYLFSDYSNFEQYKKVIENRDFNFCFYDGGIIQISYFIKDNEVLNHRLCYMPCPFNYDANVYVGLGLADIPGVMSSEELLTETRLASPLRFDFDSEFSDEKHTESHVTFNKITCRIPTYGPVSLGHFFRLVLRYFYETHFESANWWLECKPTLYKRYLNHPSPHEIHIDSAVSYS